ARSYLLAPGLADLAAQDLVGVLDALALVGVGPAQPADLGRHLTHLLAVGARDGDAVGLGVDLDLDPGWDVEDHRVRVAQGELHLRPLDLGAVADADDVELLDEAGGGALDGVGQERPHEPVLGALGAALAAPRDGHDVAVDGDGVAVEDGLLDLPLGPLGGEEPVFHLHPGPRGDRNGHLADTRHGTNLPT